MSELARSYLKVKFISNCYKGQEKGIFENNITTYYLLTLHSGMLLASVASKNMLNNGLILGKPKEGIHERNTQFSVHDTISLHVVT